MQTLRLLLPELMLQAIPHWIAPAIVPGRETLKGVRVPKVQSFPDTDVFEQEAQIADSGARSLQ